MDQGLWLARVLLLQLGGVLTARGIGDAALWEAVAGGVIGVGTAAWSWHARQAALKAPPR